MVVQVLSVFIALHNFLCFFSFEKLTFSYSFLKYNGQFTAKQSVPLITKYNLQYYVTYNLHTLYVLLD